MAQGSKFRLTCLIFCAEFKSAFNLELAPGTGASGDVGTITFGPVTPNSGSWQVSDEKSEFT